MNLSANGFLQAALTMCTAGPISAGTPVKLTDSFTVSAAEADDAFIGVALTGDERFCCVQMRGSMTLPCSGTLPQVGPAVLAADGEGGVRSVENGSNVLILAVDETAGTVTCIL